MQKEYIERAHVLKFMNALYEHHLTMRNYSADSATLDCMSIVTNAPAADVVEVVRCKDCDVPHNKWIGCRYLNGLIPPPDFYCACGKRKNDKEE